MIFRYGSDTIEGSEIQRPLHEYPGPDRGSQSGISCRRNLKIWPESRRGECNVATRSTAQTALVGQGTGGPLQATSDRRLAAPLPRHAQIELVVGCRLGLRVDLARLGAPYRPQWRTAAPASDAAARSARTDERESLAPALPRPPRCSSARHGATLWPSPASKTN